MKDSKEDIAGGPCYVGCCRVHVCVLKINTGQACLREKNGRDHKRVGDWNGGSGSHWVVDFWCWSRRERAINKWEQELSQGWVNSCLTHETEMRVVRRMSHNTVQIMNDTRGRWGERERASSCDRAWPYALVFQLDALIFCVCVCAVHWNFAIDAASSMTTSRSKGSPSHIFYSVPESRKLSSLNNEESLSERLSCSAVSLRPIRFKYFLEDFLKNYTSFCTPSNIL